MANEKKELWPIEISEKKLLQRTFEANGGNVTHTAEDLHRSLPWTRGRLKRYGIKRWAKR